MCDWIDNAITAQMAHSDGQVYGFLRFPCRVELNARLWEAGRRIPWRSLVLPDAFHAEFTGERVIPGRVEDNLFNEHLARYRFAARLAGRNSRLAGRLPGRRLRRRLRCRGTGEVRARRCWGSTSRPMPSRTRGPTMRAAPNLRFEQASCTAIPAEDNAFRLIAAFEVIEHLDDWRDFLVEARRVLDPAGLFLVSTPNRLYYAESRQKAGPNPFHVHEFTEEEFRSELALGLSAREDPAAEPRRGHRVFGRAMRRAPRSRSATGPATPRARTSSWPCAASSPCRRSPGFVFIPDDRQRTADARTAHRAARRRDPARRTSGSRRRKWNAAG